jgi:uncharacterized protein (TIGR02996 family)
MLHPDLLALIRTCKESPEDITPRLVLADWLEENGDPDRAEFIRLQFQRRSKDSSRREFELFQINRSRWLGSLSQLKSVIPEYGFFRFEISEIYLWNIKPSQLEDFAPWIEQASLTMTQLRGPVADLRHLREAQLLDEVPILKILVCPDRFGLESFSRLLMEFLTSLRSMSRLHTFRLESHALVPYDLVVLTSIPWFRKLRELSILGGPIEVSDHFARLNRDRDLMSQLRSLRIVLQDEGFTHLARTRYLHQLRHLALGSLPQSQEIVSEFTQSSLLSRLRMLSIKLSSEKDQQSFSQLISSANVQRLEVLEVDCSWEDCLNYDQAIRALIRTPYLHSLMHLRLNTEISDDVFGELVKACPFPKLSRIDFGSTFLGENRARKILESPAWNHVKHFAVGTNSELYEMSFVDLWRLQMESGDRLKLFSEE